MVKVTATGWAKPDLICWLQSIQIFCWTPARYQSPPESAPSGVPGPGGPRANPGVDDDVVASRALVGPGAGAGGSGFFLLFRASSSGTALLDGFGAASLGGFRTSGGGSAAGA